MKIVDKFDLTLRQNKIVAKKNLVQMIYATSRFEGVNTTLPQTKTIIDGMSVSGVSIEDIQVIVRLKRGMEYIIKHDEPYCLQTSLDINGIVVQDEALEWGTLRNGNIQIGGIDFIPPIPMRKKVETKISSILTADASMTYRALRLMYYMMRSQLFWDGNKRTAILTANYIMIHAGVGVVNIAEEQLETFNELLSAYYEAGQGRELEKLIKWTYNNCIYGITYRES